jgi:hypothetical protein
MRIFLVNSSCVGRHGCIYGLRSSESESEEVKMSNDNADGLDIPEFLKISQQQRKLAWAEYDLKRRALLEPYKSGPRKPEE